MLLGYNTNGCQNHRLPDALRLLADHGYQAVALTLDVAHLDPYHCSAQEVADIARLLQELPLQPVIETGARFLLDPANKHEPTLMTAGKAARQRRLDFYQRAAAIGRDLGAQVLSFWSGIDHGGNPDSGSWLEEGVAQTVALVQQAGLQAAMEPEPGMAVATVADYLQLCQHLGAAAPELCLDLGHLYVTGEGEPAEILPQVADRLVQVHLEDMRRGQHEHLLPGEGDVDFPCSFTALRTANYGGAVCFELSRSSHMAPQALKICHGVWPGGHR